MHLTYRPATAGDTEACLAMLPPAFTCPPPVRAALPQAWRRWLADGVMRMTVLEDGHRPPPTRRIAFGSGVFVSDAFVAGAKSGGEPPQSARAVREWQAGRAPSASPVLGLEAVRAANSGPGLNLLILHVGWREDLPAEEVRWAKGKLLEALLSTYGGYRLREIIQDVYSEEERDRGLAAGARLKNDYGAFYRAHPDALPPPHRRPFLLGGARDEVRDGSYLSPLFFYSPPRFFFKSGDQEVLCLALADRTDAEVAALLHLSASAVQKRWRAVYERVAAAAPGFFPSDFFPVGNDSPGNGAASVATRGAEKRRLLLGYLRVHPEELRPVSPPVPHP